MQHRDEIGTGHDARDRAEAVTFAEGWDEEPTQLDRVMTMVELIGNGPPAARRER